MAAILCTCFGLKYAVFKKKIDPFEAVNRKNNLLEALDSENGANWRVSGEEIMLCLAVVELQCRKGHSPELKRTPHHFVELILKRTENPLHKKIKGLIVNFY